MYCIYNIHPIAQVHMLWFSIDTIKDFICVQATVQSTMNSVPLITVFVLLNEGLAIFSLLWRVTEFSHDTIIR